MMRAIEGQFTPIDRSLKSVNLQRREKNTRWHVSQKSQPEDNKRSLQLRPVNQSGTAEQRLLAWRNPLLLNFSPFVVQ